MLTLESDAFNAYVDATGAVFDDVVGLFRLTPAQFANLESLFFHIGDVSVMSACEVYDLEFTEYFPRPLSNSHPMRRSSRAR